MTPWSFLPRWKARRITWISIASVFSLPLLLYIFLLMVQTASAWQANRALARLQAIRVGSPESQFQEAVRSMDCSVEHGGLDCRLVAGAYRWNKLHPLFGFYSPLGLHYWAVSTTRVEKDRTVDSLSYLVISEGRHASVGLNSILLTDMPRPVRERYALNSSVPTVVHRFQITADVLGQGYDFYITPGSTEAELSARLINRRCLYPFQSCDKITDFLPKARPFLKDE